MPLSSENITDLQTTLKFRMCRSISQMQHRLGEPSTLIASVAAMNEQTNKSSPILWSLHLFPTSVTKYSLFCFQVLYLMCAMRVLSTVSTGVARAGLIYGSLVKVDASRHRRNKRGEFSQSGPSIDDPASSIRLLKTTGYLFVSKVGVSMSPC